MSLPIPPRPTRKKRVLLGKGEAFELLPRFLGAMAVGGSAFCSNVYFPGAMLSLNPMQDRSVFKRKTK